MFCAHGDYPPRDKTGRCKECLKVWRQQPHIKERRKRDKKKHNQLLNTKLRQRERRFNLELGGYEKLFDSQDGKCYLCLTDLAAQKKTHVDHDHITGKVRGLTCVECNVKRIPGLDFIRSNPGAMERFLKACQK